DFYEAVFVPHQADFFAVEQEVAGEIPCPSFYAFFAVRHGRVVADDRRIVLVALDPIALTFAEDGLQLAKRADNDLPPADANAWVVCFEFEGGIRIRANPWRRSP